MVAAANPKNGNTQLQPAPGLNGKLQSRLSRHLLLHDSRQSRHRLCPDPGVYKIGREKRSQNPIMGLNGPENVLKSPKCDFPAWVEARECMKLGFLKISIFGLRTRSVA